MTIEEMKCPNCSAPLSRRGADWYCPFCGGAYRENGAEKPPSPPADRQGDPPPDSRAEAPYRGAEILACAQGKDVPLRAGNTVVRAVPMRFDRSQAISILRQAAPKGAVKACFSLSALQAVREVRLPLWRIACRGIAAMEGIWAERPHLPPTAGYRVAQSCLFSAEELLYSPLASPVFLRSDLQQAAVCDLEEQGRWEILGDTALPGDERWREQAKWQLQKCLPRPLGGGRFENGVWHSIVLSITEAVAHLYLAPYWCLEGTWEGRPYRLLVNGCTGWVDGNPPLGPQAEEGRWRQSRLCEMTMRGGPLCTAAFEWTFQQSDRQPAEKG